jgi:hypothetical protein
MLEAIGMLFSALRCSYTTGIQARVHKEYFSKCPLKHSNILTEKRGGISGRDA